MAKLFLSIIIISFLMISCTSGPIFNRVQKSDANKDKAIVYIYREAGGYIGLGVSIITIDDSLSVSLGHNEYVYFICNPGITRIFGIFIDGQKGAFIAKAGEEYFFKLTQGFTSVYFERVSEEQALLEISEKYYYKKSKD